MSQNPFASRAVRYSIGVSGAVTIAVLAYLFLEGTMQLLAYAIAAMDLLVTPLILSYAGEP